MSYFDKLPREMLIKIIEAGQEKYYFEYADHHIIVYFRDLQIFSMAVWKSTDEKHYQCLLDAIDGEPSITTGPWYLASEDNWGCGAIVQQFPEMDVNCIYILQIEGVKFFVFSPFVSNYHLNPESGEFITGFCISLEECIVDSLKQALVDFLNDQN